MNPDLALKHPPVVASMASQRSWLVMLLAASAGGLIAYVGMSGLINAGLANDLLSQSSNNWPLVIAGWLVAAWVAITMHELGHMTGAVSSGLLPLMLFSGPLQLELEAGRLRCSINRHRSTWGGLAVAIPRAGSPLEPRQAIWTVAGGPLSSASVALVTLIMYPYLSGLESVFLFQVGLMSLAIGVATLIPLQTGGFASDGGQLWQLLRSDARALQRLQLAAIIGRNFSGHRPRQWDLEDLQKIARESKLAVLKTSALLLAAQVIDDRPDRQAALRGFEFLAKDLHDGGLAAYPRAFRVGLTLPIAIYLAQQSRDADAAQRWMEVYTDGIEEPHERLHARAAICMARGDVAAARALALEALEKLSKSPPTGLRALASERLHAIASLEMSTIST